MRIKKTNGVNRGTVKTIGFLFCARNNHKIGILSFFHIHEKFVVQYWKVLLLGRDFFVKICIGGIRVCRIY